MQHTITTSADGSSTLQLTEFGESYHSTNGAYTEAMHIYIKAGVEHLFQKLCNTHQRTGQIVQNTPDNINIFDVGFGTALNCILLYAWQQQLRQRGLPFPKIHYFGIEKYPIQPTEAQQLNYPSIIAEQLNLPPDKLAEIFHLMHKCQWEKDAVIPPLSEGNCQPDKECHSSEFILHKSCADIAALEEKYYREACGIKGPAVVFYDTFSPATQPYLWDEEIFCNIAAGCPAGSVLVTYCSKGTVKQALRNAGFTLERLAGPPGKRHIIRGTL